VKEQEEDGPWSTFGPLVEGKAAPKIDRSKLSCIRQVTPMERLAGWAIQGRLVLLLGLLLLVGLQLPSLYPSQILRLLAIVTPIFLIFRPLLGHHPSATPIRTILVTFSALCLGVLALWPTEYVLRYQDLKDSDLSDHPWFWQSSLEAAANFKTLAVLFFVLLISLGARYLERTYYWVEFENRYGRWRSRFSVLSLTVPLLLVLVVIVYLLWAPGRLSWTEQARQSDPYQNALKLRDLEKYTLAAEVFKPMENQQPEVMKAVAKDIPQQEFIQGLAIITRQLEDPSFRPSHEDRRLLAFIGQRAFLKGQPTDQTAEFGLALWKLTNRSKAEYDFWATQRLIDEHVLPLIFEADEQELQEWKKRILPLETFRAESSDIDALLWQNFEGQYISSLDTRPLELFGIQVADRSPAPYFQWLKWQAVLLDYDHRRELLRSRDQKLSNEAIAGLETSPWYWNDRDINRAYRFLNWKLNPKHLESELQLLRTAITLRDARLTTGQYPPKLPESAPQPLDYECLGDKATLKKPRSEEDGGPIEWSLR
jgi:hypothetical protein